MMDAERDISCFETCPPGTGKTTASAIAAAQSNRTWRYCILPMVARPRDVTATIYTAVFERPAKGTERQMSDALRERLSDGDMGIVADEVHNVGLTGAQQLRYLWDGTAIYGTPFPLLLVGCAVRVELLKAEEVLSRVARWVNFGVVTDLHDAKAIASAQHPRLAATSDKIIEGMNNRIARRSIRNWTQIGKHVAYLPSTDPTGKKVTGLTAADVRLLRSMLGQDQAAA